MRKSIAFRPAGLDGLEHRIALSAAGAAAAEVVRFDHRLGHAARADHHAARADHHESRVEWRAAHTAGATA